jgi:hypothetical protein
MKFLEKGPGWSMKCRCTGNGNGGCGCGALLQIEKDDIYLTHSYDYGGGHDIFYTFRCLECGAETDIEETKVPASIRRNLLEGYRSSNTLRR